MVSKYELARDWLPRYTGMPVDHFGDYILLSNFDDYFDSFVERVFLRRLWRGPADEGGHEFGRSESDQFRHGIRQRRYDHGPVDGSTTQGRALPRKMRRR